MHIENNIIPLFTISLSSHTTSSILSAMIHIKSSFISKFKSWPPSIDSITVDFSLALANSVCFFINEISLDQYLMECFKNINEPIAFDYVFLLTTHPILIILFFKTKLSFCSSHVIKDFSSNLKQNNINSEAAEELKHFFGSIICEKKIERFFHLIMCFLSILKSEFFGENCQIYSNELKFSACSNPKKSTIAYKKILKMLENTDSSKKYQNSPFYLHVESSLKFYPTDSKGIKNLFYAPSIAQNIEVRYLRLAPLWGSFFVQRTSNSSVECLNKVLKIDILNRGFNLKPSRAYRLIQKYADSKIFSLEFNLKKTTKKKTREPEEKWSKKPDYRKLFSSFNCNFFTNPSLSITGVVPTFLSQGCHCRPGGSKIIFL